MISAATSLAAALLPVLIFLGVLVWLDSYQLVRPRSIALMLGTGALAAFASLGVHELLMLTYGIGQQTLTHYVAPVVEELCKGAVLIVLIRRHRIGFMVDAAISGFAIGAGFATIENLHYFYELGDPHLLLWILRGLGTAVMHGGVTAILAVISRHLADRFDSTHPAVFLPGFAFAIGYHSFFNHLVLSPYLFTMLQVILLPSIFGFVFRSSEEGTRDWLGTGFDTDSELLEMIHTGQASATRAGYYLEGMRDKLPGEKLADLICLVRLHAELSIQAKGILLAREVGITIEPDPEIQERFAELTYLESSLGKSSVRALSPVFNLSSRELWQLYMLGGQARRPG